MYKQCWVYFLFRSLATKKFSQKYVYIYFFTYILGFKKLYSLQHLNRVLLLYRSSKKIRFHQKCSTAIKILNTTVLEQPWHNGQVTDSFSISIINTSKRWTENEMGNCKIKSAKSVLIQHYTALFSYNETSHTLTSWSVPLHWWGFTFWPVTSPSTDEILLPATYGSNRSDKAYFCHFLLEDCLCRSWKLANRNT